MCSSDLRGSLRLLIAEAFLLRAPHRPVGVQPVVGGFAVAQRPDNVACLAILLVEVMGGRGGESANRDALADHRGDPPRSRLRSLCAKRVCPRRPRDAGMFRERQEHVGHEFPVGRGQRFWSGLYRCGIDGTRRDRSEGRTSELQSQACRVFLRPRV